MHRNWVWQEKIVWTLTLVSLSQRSHKLDSYKSLYWGLQRFTSELLVLILFHVNTFHFTVLPWSLCLTCSGILRYFSLLSSPVQFRTLCWYPRLLQKISYFGPPPLALTPLNNRFAPALCRFWTRSTKTLPFRARKLTKLFLKHLSF